MAAAAAAAGMTGLQPAQAPKRGGYIVRSCRGFGSALYRLECEAGGKTVDVETFRI